MHASHALLTSASEQEKRLAEQLDVEKRARMALAQQLAAEAALRQESDASEATRAKELLARDRETSLRRLRAGVASLATRQFARGFRTWAHAQRTSQRHRLLRRLHGRHRTVGLAFNTWARARVRVALLPCGVAG